MRHLFIYPLVFLIGCQSTTKIDCSKVDWRNKGQLVATAGLQKNQALEDLVIQCKKKDPLVDHKAFKAGYKDGLMLFCKAEVGLSMGKAGKLYNNTCPKSEELSFLKGYINGRIIYLKDQLNQSKGDYANAKDRFWRKEQEYLLIKSEDPEEAKMQRDFLEAYQEESNQLRKSTDALKKELNYLKRKREELNFN